jgi:hypothetical protein
LSLECWSTGVMGVIVSLAHWVWLCIAFTGIL